MMNRYIVLVAMAATLMACKKKKIDEQRDIFVQEQADHCIAPSHELFKNAADKLSQKINALTQNPTSSNLAVAKQQWQVTVKAYFDTKVYDIGAVKDNYGHLYLGNWPVDTTKIKTQMQDYPNNPDVPSKVRGLFAIEWLLFTSNAMDSLQNESHYNTFLNTIAEDFKNQAIQLQASWEDYDEVFRLNEGENQENSFNQLVNGYIQFLDRIKYQVGLPLGKYSLNVVDSLNALSPYANYTQLVIEDEIQLLSKIWGGKAINEHEVTALYDVVAIVNETLAKQIDEQLKVVEEQSAQISNFNSALYNDQTKVENLYNALGDLLTLFKSDVVSELGITLLFSDNDGD